MPRRSTKTASGIIAYAILAIVLVVLGLLNFIVDNPWILWILLPIAVIAIAARWFYVRKTELLREEERQRAEESLKRAEEERVKTIHEYIGEWGDVMCQWLVNGQYSLTDSRTAAIMNNFATLGQDTCQRLLQKTIAIGDSPDVVKLALGEPTSVDEKLVTEKVKDFRWIYGVPRRGATYIWFKNDVVTKIKQ